MSDGVQDAALLSARGLCLDVAGRRLISDVDLTIAAARCTVIVGANGAGKSLLIRLLHGLIVPTVGTIRWRGGPLDAAARREQAMVFQRPVMMRRSVGANLRFALSVRGLRGAERRAREDEALALARLGTLRDTPARVLSGGEQQRLALARALVCSPRLIFLDEPTASLDPASTLAVERLILDARGRGVSTVLVTHDAGQARRLGDDLIFMHGGSVAETGPVAQVLDSPRSGPARAWTGGMLFTGPTS